MKIARGRIRKREVGAGDILWSDSADVLEFALVLEPEVQRERCGEMLYLVMVAFGDAAGAISAPEIAITYRWPSQILINEAIVGEADLHLSDDNDGNFPEWLIVGMKIGIKPDHAQSDPGYNMDKTTMWDEGCGNISRTELLESVTRHIVNWIHTWSEDGFKPVHDQWIGRVSEKRKIMPGLSDADFIGLDESGNALLKQDDTVVSINTLDALLSNASKPTVRQ